MREEPASPSTWPGRPDASVTGHEAGGPLGDHTPLSLQAILIGWATVGWMVLDLAAAAVSTDITWGVVAIGILAPLLIAPLLAVGGGREGARYSASAGAIASYLHGIVLTLWFLRGETIDEVVLVIAVGFIGVFGTLGAIVVMLATGAVAMRAAPRPRVGRSAPWWIPSVAVLGALVVLGLGAVL